MAQEIPDRKEVLRRIFQSQTREEVTEARRLRNLYLNAHPDDDSILEASETLEMAAGILGLPKVDPSV